MADTGVSIESGDTAKIWNGSVEVSFDLKDGRYSGIDRASQTTMFRDAWFDLDPGETAQWRRPAYTYRAEELGAVQDTFGKGRRLRVWYVPSESYDPERFLDVTLYESKPFLAIGWGVRNPFEYAVRVQKAIVLSDGKFFDGQNPTDEKVLRSGAGRETNFVEDTWRIDALNGAMLTYRDGDTRRTLVAGGLHYGEFARRVVLDEGKKRRSRKETTTDDRRMSLTIWDPQGKRVEHGETWVSQDSFYLDFTTTNPFVSLEQYGESLAQANGARPNVYDFPTLCGWMASSGGHGDGIPINDSPGLVGQVDLARERGMLRYMPLAVRLEPDSYCYANQGDTQQGWWDDAHWARYGSLREPDETFAKFSEAVEDRGGIVFTYFQGSLPSNDFAVAHPSWMLDNDISRLHADHAHHRPLVRYDYSDPGFQAHVREVWRRLRAAGVRGIKFDYPETAWARYGGFEDKSYTTTGAYRELFRLCREGLGPDAFLHERNMGGETHESVPLLDVTAGIVDLQRVWGDASYFDPEMASRIGLRWFKQGKVFRYYPDGKSFYAAGPQPKKPLSRKDRRTFLTLIGLLSGRIEIGTNISRVTDEMMHDLTRLYPMLPNGQAFRPVDMLLGKRHPEVYVYQVAPEPGHPGADPDAAGRNCSAILVNSDKENPKAIVAPLAGPQPETGSLGLDAEGSYWIFDFWNQRSLGLVGGREKLEVELQPGEALVYSIRKSQARPMVLGTNRHVMCGLFELHDAKWDAAGRTLSFSADVIGGEEMVVTLAVPDQSPGFALQAVRCEGAQAAASQNGSIVAVRLSSERNARATAYVAFSAGR